MILEISNFDFGFLDGLKEDSEKAAMEKPVEQKGQEINLHQRDGLTASTGERMARHSSWISPASTSRMATATM